MTSRAPFLILLLLAAACSSATTSVGPATSRPQPPPAMDPDSIRWVRESAEFQAAFVQAYRHATIQVEKEGALRAAGSWAVVLDADETVINNSTYQVERARLGLAFTPDSWNVWVKRRQATPLPGAGAFLARVRELGGKIAIVTNRLQSECEDTAAVFTTHALVYDAMLCRLDGTPSDKNARFEAVARGRSAASASPLEIVAFVGDNIQDFPAMTQGVKAQGPSAFEDFGVRYFVVPNPMYGSWQ